MSQNCEFVFALWGIVSRFCCSSSFPSCCCHLISPSDNTIHLSSCRTFVSLHYLRVCVHLDKPFNFIIGSHGQTTIAYPHWALIECSSFTNKPSFPSLYLFYVRRTLSCGLPCLTARLSSLRWPSCWGPPLCTGTGRCLRGFAEGGHFPAGTGFPEEEKEKTREAV